ncbi:hypothetical protein SAMN02745945_00570 [Peptoclostridium litorale DSM 5388]|uniref:Uncharacterized protein n=1 Tax=Peptoclostridium litorale DSM 5388 TaxID=1121324 RepID=A0A069RLJ2_PEPLI|nr:hypothetical protein CLIT_11c00910 [Peptoclostridium litorale DSM 5388]SIN75636.1 hypothetical protein SAMN02745945_00570 [Peptoclostridium litorale DSM 5388]
MEWRIKLISIIENIEHNIKKLKENLYSKVKDKGKEYIIS